MFRKKEEKSLLQWTIEEDGKYQSKLIDIIAERNNRINKAIEYIKVNHILKCIKPNVIFEITNEKLDKLLDILKGVDKE